MAEIRKIGSVSTLSINNEETYNFNDIMYINSYHNMIKKLYSFLRVYYVWSTNSKQKLSYTNLVKKHRIDSHLLSIMKQYGYVNEDSSIWSLENQPTKGDAVFLQLKVRDYYKKKGNK